MATKKSKNIGIKGTKLNNSMAQLVAGIVPGSQTKRGSLSPNAINAISSLMLQVRGEYLTLNYGLLTCLYQQFGLIQSLVEVPVLDAFRGGIKFTGYENKVILPEKKKKHIFRFWNADDSKQQPQRDAGLDFQIEQMKKREEWEKEQVAKDEKDKKAEDSYFRDEVPGQDIRRMEIYLRRDQTWRKVQQALFWNRLYGGSAIVVLDGRDPKTELKLEDVNQDTPLEFYVTDNWEISGMKIGRAHV